MTTARRLHLFFILAIATPAARAIPTRADVLLEQLPTHVGGPGADTSFYSDFGTPIYQVTADDFRFSETKEVLSLRWWSFYGGNFSGSPFPPVGDETIRVRFYDDSGDSGLPGEVLYEESYLNPSRVLTGQWGCGCNNAREYQFDVDLTTPFQAEANRRYWLEMVQIGDINSTYRREYALTDGTPYATISPNSNHVWIYSETQANLSFQIIGVPEVNTLTMGLMISVLLRQPYKRNRRSVLLGDRHAQPKEARACHPPELPNALSCSPLLP